MAVTISIDDCTKMIRGALKQGFPNTKFSVRKTRSTYSHNIDVRWTDGPTGAQVKPILDRFESKGFDGMTDCQYSCGNRILCGVRVEVCGNYVRGSRTISGRLRLLVAKKIISDAKLDNLTVSLDQWDNLRGVETVVPFAWSSHWDDKPYMTVTDFESRTNIMAHDAIQGEWLSQLLYRIENHISLEEQQPINAELLPEYIDVNADVSTGRASFEEPQKMFEGHAALETERVLTPADEGFIAARVDAAQATKIDCHCHIGRSYPKQEGWLQ